MAKFVIPAHELKAHVEPRDGAMWKDKPIDQSEINAALATGVREERLWDDIVNTLSHEETRKFHINRIATLVREKPSDAIVIIVENHTNTVRVYLHDGNHHLAAAYVHGDSLITAIVAASKPESIGDVFPGAVLQ